MASVVLQWRGEFDNLEANRLVAATARRQRIGMRLVLAARDGAARAGCEFLHVDFDPRLRRFYIDECGFKPTGGGLMELR
jgi:predicted N-acetyltransferase YhbS